MFCFAEITAAKRGERTSGVVLITMSHRPHRMVASQKLAGVNVTQPQKWKDVIAKNAQMGDLQTT